MGTVRVLPTAIAAPASHWQLRCPCRPAAAGIEAGGSNGRVTDSLTAHTLAVDMAMSVEGWLVSERARFQAAQLPLCVLPGRPL